jgi:hypothetical protein
MFNRGTLENLKQKASSVAQTGVAKSKQLAEIAKLRANCLSEEEAIKKAYIEIGKLYYAERGDAPEGAYVALCSRISKAKDTIAQNHAEIEAMKESKDFDGDIVLDYESEFAADDLQGEATAEEAEEAPCCCAEEPADEAPAQEETEEVSDEADEE